MFSKILSILTAVLTSALLLILAAFLGLRAAGYRPYIVLSGSMEPVIHTGALAFVNTKETGAKEGDIVTFETGEGTENRRTITHRVVESTESFIRTKGDANREADPNPVPRGRIIGIYRFEIPHLGYMLEKGGKKIFLSAAAAVILLQAAVLLLGGEEKAE